MRSFLIVISQRSRPWLRLTAIKLASAVSPCNPEAGVKVATREIKDSFASGEMIEWGGSGYAVRFTGGGADGQT